MMFKKNKKKHQTNVAKEMPSESLPVRVDFTNPLPLKATISPCAASSPGGAVVPDGVKFPWIYGWKDSDALMDAHIYVYIYIY